jgi:hypothetical protein
MPRRANIARPLAAAGFASILFSGGTVAAATVEVHATGCADLDEREVDRLLSIELAFVASAPPLREAIHVELSCTGNGLRISAIDPATQKPLEREVVLGPPEPGRERTIALLASQLLITSWAESFLTRSAPPPTAPLEPPSHRSETPVRLEESSPSEHRAPTAWEIGLGAGARVRDWSSPATDPRVFLRPSIGFGRFGLLLDVAYERGSAPRTDGTVDWSMISGGFGAGWRSRRLGIVALEATATTSLVWILAEGEAVSPRFVGDSRHGIAGEGAISAGPMFAIGPMRIALDLETGVVLPGVTARSSGDSNVALGGVWAGASLRVGAGGGTW